MSARDLDRRQATTEFLDFGLGSRLTQTARFLLSTDVGGFQSESQRQLAVVYACGNIIERILWAGLGAWMGYFEDLPAVSDEESATLQEYAAILVEMEILQNFWDFDNAVMNSGLSSKSVAQRFIWENLGLFPLKQKMVEWFPKFQAALIASEMLTDESITSFFLFLRAGNVQQFQEHQLSADEVLNQLSETHTVYNTFHERTPGTGGRRVHSVHRIPLGHGRYLSQLGDAPRRS